MSKDKEGRTQLKNRGNKVLTKQKTIPIDPGD